MMAVPTVYASLLDVPHGEHDLSSLRHSLVGAAPMPIEVFNRFERSTGLRLLESQGMTEGTAVASLNPIAGRRKVGSIRLPLPSNGYACPSNPWRRCHECPHQSPVQARPASGRHGSAQ
jgi:acyl-CoA synthetase (AMP-forming)/AMP-acid ligase II